MSSVPAIRAAGASTLPRVLAWCVDALRLWRRAPLMLVALGVAMLVIEALLQQVPLAGMALSKLVVGMIGSGIWLGLDDLRQGQRLRLSCLWRAWRHPRLPALLLLNVALAVLVNGVQLAIASLVYGHGALDAVVAGHMAAHPELATRAFVYTLILPGMLPSTLTTFALPLFLFRGAAIGAALADSLRLVALAPFAFALVALLQTLLLAASLYGGLSMLLLLLVMPWSAALGFAIWMDVDAHAAPRVRV